MTMQDVWTSPNVTAACARQREREQAVRRRQQHAAREDRAQEMLRACVRERHADQRWTVGCPGAAVPAWRFMSAMLPTDLQYLPAE